MQSNKTDVSYNQKIILESIEVFSEKLGFDVFAVNGICDHLSGLFLYWADKGNANHFYSLYDYFFYYNKLEENKKAVSEKTRVHTKAVQFIQALRSLFLNHQIPFKLLGAYWLNSIILSANNLAEFEDLIVSHSIDSSINASRFFRIDIGISHSISLVSKNLDMEIKYILYNSNDKGKAKEFASKAELAQAIYLITKDFRGKEENIILNLHEISFEKNEEFIKRENAINQLYDTVLLLKETQKLSEYENNFEVLIDEYKQGKSSQLTTLQNIIFLINRDKHFLPETILQFLESLSYLSETNSYQEISEQTFYNTSKYASKIGYIHLASYNGDLPLLEKLITHPKVDINQKLATKQDAIFLAVNNGHSLAVEILIKNNANLKQFINTNDDFETKMTLLHFSALSNDYVTFKTLFHHVKYILPYNDNMETPLTLAAKNGYLSFITQLLNDSPINIKIEIRDITSCMKSNHFICTEYLLDKFINDFINTNLNGDKLIFQNALEDSLVHPHTNRLNLFLYDIRDTLFAAAIHSNSLRMLQLLVEKYNFKVDFYILKTNEYKLANKNPELFNYLYTHVKKVCSNEEKGMISKMAQNNRLFSQSTQNKIIKTETQKKYNRI